MIACHWRDDNTYRIRSLSRMERLASFGAPDWAHLNLIGVRDAEVARRVLTIARLYAGEERRIAELRLEPHPARRSYRAAGRRDDDVAEAHFRRLNRF